MGELRDSFEYDTAIEAASLWFLRQCVEGGADRAEEHKRMRLAVAEVTHAAEGWKCEAVRARSPHRSAGLAWESLVHDWLKEPGSPLRRALVGLASARILETVLDLPQVTLDRLAREARLEMGSVLARFHEQAGKSGAVLASTAKGGTA